MNLAAPANSTRAQRPLDPTAAFLADALHRLDSLGERQRIALITLPAPLATATGRASLMRQGAPTVLWEPPSGPSLAGVGCAVMLTAAGPQRITDIARQASAVWPRIEPIVYPGLTPLAPRLLGGFAFAENAASAPPWTEFGDARFVLPRWLYSADGTAPQLTLAVDTARPGEVRAVQSVALAELQSILAALARREPAALAPAAPVVARDEMDPARWRRHIEDIRAAIRAGACDKIVAARRSVVELGHAIDPGAVLASLAARYPDCYRFGFRFGPEAAFVGATPERLIEHHGDRISTAALAGSIAADEVMAGAAVPGGAEPEAQRGAGSSHRAAAAQALLASGKDRSEQSMVTRAIAEVLAPMCAELDVPDEPEIRVLRQVLHLETPIRGRLLAPVHILELAAALHPTPAVGGVPTEAAMSWIASREPAPRGWYAAPVGWFDAEGQGELAVAIRSGVLAGRTAHIYVGAGIMRDSDPDAEYAETHLKGGALLGALGVEH